MKPLSILTFLCLFLFSCQENDMGVDKVAIGSGEMPNATVDKNGTIHVA